MSPRISSCSPASTITSPPRLRSGLHLFITIVIHEFGHAILCRVEDIKVKGMGVLLAVIPIGFFVEPDDAELEQKKGMPKVRMFGAGITNNLVVGFCCFVLLILMFGMVVPETRAGDSTGSTKGILLITRACRRVRW